MTRSNVHVILNLCEYETCYLTLREDEEFKVTRIIYGPKAYPIILRITRGWRDSHNEVLYNFCASQNVIRVIKSRKRARRKDERDGKCITNFVYRS
jgi:hypothetical protein